MFDVSSYVKAFEAYLISLNKSFHTVKQYTIDANQFARITKDCESVGDALPLYQNEMQQQYRSSNSINRKYAAIRQFLSFLQMRGVITTYDEAYLQKIAKDQSPLFVLSKKQLQQALAFWPHQFDIALNEEHAWLAVRNAAIVYTIAELALKPAELVRMQWKHIDSESNELTVLASKSYRILSMSKELVALLNHYQKHTLQWLPLTENAAYIWLGVGNKLGEPISVKTIERIFQAMSQQLGFKVTATNVRYHSIQQELTAAKQDDLFKQFGYSRKGVLDERQQRFPKK